MHDVHFEAKGTYAKIDFPTLSKAMGGEFDEVIKRNEFSHEARKIY